MTAVAPEEGSGFLGSIGLTLCSKARTSDSLRGEAGDEGVDGKSLEYGPAERYELSITDRRAEATHPACTS